MPPRLTAEGVFLQYLPKNIAYFNNFTKQCPKSHLSNVYIIEG